MRKLTRAKAEKALVKSEAREPEKAAAFRRFYEKMNEGKTEMGGQQRQPESQKRKLERAS